MPGATDLRKIVKSAQLPSPALGSVTHHVEIERLFSNFLTKSQAEIVLHDFERVAAHYGYQREFAKRAYEQLKRNEFKLGTKELWNAFYRHQDELDSEVLAWITELLAYPHLYRHPNDKHGLHTYEELADLERAQTSSLPLDGGKQDTSHASIVRDLCLSYGRYLFGSRNKNIKQWWRQFRKLADFCMEKNAFMSMYKEACLVLCDFMYKFGGTPEYKGSVENGIAQLLHEKCFHYKAYVGNPQAEVFMYAILTFTRQMSPKVCATFMENMQRQFDANSTNVKRCEMVAWSVSQFIPAINRMSSAKKERNEVITLVGKFISKIFESWSQSQSTAVRQWAAMCYYQFKRYAFDTVYKFKEETAAMIERNLSSSEWDADHLTSGVFPIFDEDNFVALDMDFDGDDDDGDGKKKKKKKKKKREASIGNDMQCILFGVNCW
mmetsp:Transcript_42104/g.69379  ORF Transcript_42104/g.69379 Transcript_42104/m.69379 type:complete len:437 (+) Transcript_42104:33-1343(+)